MTAFIEVRNLTVEFGRGDRRIVAVDAVNIDLPRGVTIGLVGESGSGKSTLGRALAGLLTTKRGSVVVDGADMTNPSGKRLRQLRRRLQMVFQDSAASLDPRMQVGEAIEEGVRANSASNAITRRIAVAEALDQVGLSASTSGRYPHQLSGGQRQRVAIARALAARPDVLILDEVTSALDVSVQASVLNLLRDLQQSLSLTYLLISHNLSVVRHMSDVIAVMYLGRILETGPADTLYGRPQHPYTRALIEAIPKLLVKPTAAALGEAPDSRFPPTGCRYRTRCVIGPLVYPDRRICSEHDPSFDATGRPRAIACHFAESSIEIEGDRSPVGILRTATEA